MSFLSNLFGSNNNYTAGNAAKNPYITQQEQLVPTIQSVQGNYGNVFANQDALAKALLAQSQGQGPNPALAQLAQTTGQNVAAQNALAAGQRGANANVGLMARQAAQQGAQIQQNATGQAATLRANQMLGAQQALGNVYAQQGQLANQNLGINQQALASQNNATVGATSAANQTNAAIAGQNSQTNSGIFGGLMQGAGAALGLFAEGGEVSRIPKPPVIIDPVKAKEVETAMRKAFNYADGGEVDPNAPSSSVGKFLKGFGQNLTDQSSNVNSAYEAGSNMGQSIGQTIGGLGKMVFAPSPMAGAKNIAPAGITDLKPLAIPRMAHAGMLVPGIATEKGDSLKNDKVHALLSPKEIVLPRSVTLHPNAPEKAKEFVQAILNKKHMGKK